MSPVTHFLTGWVLANAADLNRRDRAVVTLAAVVPDADGLGVVAEISIYCLQFSFDSRVLWSPKIETNPVIRWLSGNRSWQQRHDAEREDSGGQNGLRELVHGKWTLSMEVR